MTDANGLIASNYRIDPSRPGPAHQGELRTFTVIDRRDPELHLIAIETRPDLPARPRMPLARNGPPVPYAILPLDYGNGWDLSGKPGFYVVSDGLPGTPVRIGRHAWRESDLMAFVLQPAASALAALQARGLTHRAINPDNLFRSGARDPVTLGPFWAAPPASLQPDVFEPPYMAGCLPTGRGDGTIADDVYALGVTLLALAVGRTPLAELDGPALLRRKIDLGSFAALTAGAVLPPLMADLLRGMLAEDPDHRPSPALLLRPEQARARRVGARPPRRAEQPLVIGGLPAWSSRELALTLGQRSERGYAMLRNGEVERWLRRGVGDPQLGMQVQEITRRHDDMAPGDVHAQGMLVMRSIAAIDPLAPLVWRGISIQPDGLGCAFVGAPPETLTALEEIVLADGVGHYATASQHRPEAPSRREEQRDWRNWLSARGPGGGLKRLIYGTNPMLPCASPLLAGVPVVRVADLLPALDRGAAQADRTRPPIDAHIAAFLAARADTALAGELAQVTSFATPADRLIILRLFGRLQSRLHPDPLPDLAGWLVSSGLVVLDDWRNRRTRAALQDQVIQAVKNGEISTLLEVLEDEAARRADAAGAESARVRVREIEQMLAEIEAGAAARARAADLLGTEIVTGAGLIAGLGAAMALALQ